MPASSSIEFVGSDLQLRYLITTATDRQITSLLAAVAQSLTDLTQQLQIARSLVACTLSGMEAARDCNLCSFCSFRS